MNIKNIGRNDPCPCGSGKKYKQCCQNKIDTNNTAAKNRLLESIPDLFIKARQATLEQELNKAETLYLEILSIDPKHSKSLNNLGLIKQNLGDHNASIIFFERAIKSEPNAQFYSNLGLSYISLDKISEAIQTFKKAILLNPGDHIAHANLGILFCSKNNYKDGYFHLQKSLQLAPKYTNALYNLGSFLMRQGKYKIAQEYYQKALTIEPSTLIFQNYLFCLCFDENAFPDKYLKLAKEAESFYCKLRHFKYQSWPNSSDINTSQLKIGLVSGDLRNHPVGFFLENIIYHLNYNKIKLFAYSNNTNQTELTERIKPYFDKWHMVYHSNDKDLATQIYNDGIDILIDLTGHTANSRLPMFAYTPAPIQISWLGYFASTGLSYINYFIADPISVPIDKQFQFREKIHYLPHTRLCFSPPDDDSIQPNILPSLSNDYITLGCFQNLSKINDKILNLWSDILRKTKSKLLIKNAQLDDAFIKLEFLEYLEKFSIFENQCIFEGHSSRDEYLKSYHQVDFMLDTFPYPGGTTTCEALWMGVPTLTLTGNTLLERQGHSLLHNAGLDNWICNTHEEYIQKAIDFCQNREYLANLRQSLRHQVKNSYLMDAKKFAEDFENCLFDIWQQGNN